MTVAATTATSHSTGEAFNEGTYYTGQRFAFGTSCFPTVSVLPPAEWLARDH